ncbi:MAG: PilZ domain-containing protein [Candidatus Omnitrophica bacterium]|nr:PilZ domain-containing protein [Candidatus Omnitrophota bacterium]
MDQRRKFVRLETTGKVIYSLKPGTTERKEAILQDISISGARVISDEIITTDREFSIILQIPGINHGLSGKATVKWQRRITEQMFDTGIEFVHMQEADRKALVSFVRESAGRIDDQRKYVRCPLEAEIKYKLLSQGKDVTKNCNSIDISVSGLKLFMKEKLEKGTQMRIEFNLPGEKNLIVADCVVVAWSKSAPEEMFVTGAEFIDISEENVEKISKYVKAKLAIIE